MGGAASRIFLVLASDSRTDSSRKRREALAAAAAAATAHVVTCEGVRRERAAAAAVSPGRAWRSVAPRCPAQFLRLLLRRDCASKRASPRELPLALPPFSQPPWTDRAFSRSIGYPLRGLEALSVGPVPARFLLLPVEAPEMSFSISSEMNQVRRAGPTDGGGGRGRGRDPI